MSVALSPTLQEVVLQRCRHLIVEHVGCPDEDVQLDSELDADLGCDPLDRVEIVMLIEDEFNVEISDPDVEAMHTVRDLVTWLVQRGGGK